MDGNDTMSETTVFRFDDMRQRIVVACLFALISVLGTVGNSLVIVAVFLSRKLRTTTNVFVVNLSLADLFTCLFLPWNIVALLSPTGWPMDGTVCAIAAVVLFTCVSCSVYTLAAIAINRFVIITRPMRKYKTYYSRWKLVLMVGVTWGVSLFIAIIPLIFGLGELGYDTKYSTCTHKTSHPLSDYYSMAQAMLIYPIPMVTIVVCYVAVFRHVRNHAKSITEQSESSSTQSQFATQPTMRRESSHHQSISRRQVEITKNLFYVVCAFILCITPYCAALVIPRSEPFIPWAGAVILANSCINPAIYATKHPYFKQVIRAILCCRLSTIPEPASCLRSSQTRWKPR
ncbi:beta-4C adrenergic receptor-like [Patiria miniata]|uniref:G-protein coupled receptors family 1 profile domain-containing protein n=1 Tax=Patiria miniata TaxID=46514 RepID=A0A913ZUZ8_PATMI|nr:beta-4C adrenergic receptor-like [Patiria miniata]